jgi:hypothetical protein
MGPGETRSSIIRVWQREQRGRSIAVKNCWDEDTMLPPLGGSINGLPVTDNGQGRAVMDDTVLFRVPKPLVNIAHVLKELA